VARGLGDQVDTNFTRGALQNLGGQKCPKFGAIFDYFRLWSRMSQKGIDMSKIWIALDQLHFIAYWPKKIWWTLVHQPKSYRRSCWPTQLDFFRESIIRPVKFLHTLQPPKMYFKSDMGRRAASCWALPHISSWLIWNALMCDTRRLVVDFHHSPF